MSTMHFFFAFMLCSPLLLLVTAFPSHENSVDDMEISRQARISYVGKKWPNGVIPFTIESDVIPKQIENFLEACATLQRVSCVRCRPADMAKDTYWLNVYGTGPNCQATLGWMNVKGGRKGLPGVNQWLSLKESCSNGTTLHELLHTLGFDHEQNRDDRDNYVTIYFEDDARWDNSSGQIELYKKAYKKLSLAQGDPVTVYGLPYNYESIMHYGPKFGAVDGYTNVMEAKPNPPKDAVGDPTKMGNRQYLTETDIKMINARYCNTGKEDGDPTAQPTTTGKPTTKNPLCGFFPFLPMCQ